MNMIEQNDFKMDYTINPVPTDRRSVVFPTLVQMEEIARGPSLGSNHDIDLAKYTTEGVKE